VPFFTGLTLAVAQFALSLALVYVVALLIDRLATPFGGSADRLAAFKLAAYSYAPVWLAGAFTLVPRLAFLSILGLYGL
jgi:hypothetical protein